MDEAKLDERKRELAARVVELAKQAVLTNAPFLAPALQKLCTSYRTLHAPFGTNGRELFVDADVVLSEYARTRQPPVHDLVHVLLHCLLLHPFMRESSSVDRDAWDLASDIEVERLAAELLGPRRGPRGEALGVIVSTLERDLGMPLSTERIYRALEKGTYARRRSQWHQVVAVDDSLWWPESKHRLKRLFGGAGESPDASQRAHGGGGPHTSGASRTLKKPGASPDARRSQSEQQDGRSKPQDSSGERHNKPLQQRTRSVQEALDERSDAGGLGASPERLRQEWRRAACSVHLDLKTMSRDQGRSLRELSHALEVSGTPRADLATFLRQFASYHETLRISPDEFDYVFYTYGLELFGNMPLIENLEVSEQRRVHDFVIVVDTSASVEGQVVQRFVEEAYGVLSTEDLFCDRVNVHVVQCDAAVRDDAKLTSKADLERWKSHLVLRGFGGTDFRPAFAYVDELVAKGEFEELAGLLYFTDGWGTYPVHPPAYRTAFVFYDSSHSQEAVPPWAMQLELSREQLERGVHEH